MKLLLDENLPRQLKNDLDPPHIIFTTTGDKNLQHQQNFAKYPIPVIVLDTKFITYPFLKKLVPQILALLENTVPVGPNIIQG